ncbi:MAG TPA: hypothetical protein PKG60_15450, partial [Spirochaetota bacterium]|nr:hypothetical protein [Spirochaetota bacterium]
VSLKGECKTAELYLLFMSNHIRRVYESCPKSIGRRLKQKPGTLTCQVQLRLSYRIFCVIDLIFRDIAAAWKRPGLKWETQWLLVSF